VLGVGLAHISAVADSSTLGQSSINFGSSNSTYSYSSTYGSSSNRESIDDEISEEIRKLSTQAQQKEDRLVTLAKEVQRAAQTVPDTLSDMKKWAEQGNVEYQIEVGRIYYEGEGVRQDLVLSRRMFQKAANKGDARGQAMLAHFYEYGLGGLRQNRAAAKELYGKICDKGYQAGCDEYRRLNQRGY